MTARLLPPVSTGHGKLSAADMEAQTVGPSFIRSTHTKALLWHRPRAGVRYTDRDYTAWRMWCGTCAFSTRSVTSETAPAGEPVCATCEGRAAGAGAIHSPTDYETRFTPRWIDPPPNCPGSRTDLFERLGHTAGRCLVCGAVESVRGMGSWHNPREGITQHPSNARVIESRCDFHGWFYLGVRDDALVCTGCLA